MLTKVHACKHTNTRKPMPLDKKKRANETSWVFVSRKKHHRIAEKLLNLSDMFSIMMDSCYVCQTPVEMVVFISGAILIKSFLQTTSTTSIKACAFVMHQNPVSKFTNNREKNQHFPCAGGKK